MNERMDNYLENDNIINKAHIEYQRGNRTTDHILTSKPIEKGVIQGNPLSPLRKE